MSHCRCHASLSIALLERLWGLLDRGYSVQAGFVDATMQAGYGRYFGPRQIVVNVDAKRLLLSEWLEGLVSDAALELVRQGEAAGDIKLALRQAAESERSVYGDGWIVPAQPMKPHCPCDCSRMR